MATATTEPWADLEQLFERVQHEFLPVFGPIYRWPSVRAVTVWAATDIEDTGGAFEVHSDLPGFSKPEIDVRVQGQVLHLKAERKTDPTDAPNHTYLRQERSYQAFERSFELPEPVEAEKVTATYENGVLRVVVPKAHPISERKVEIA